MTKIQTLTDQVQFNNPVALFVGRKRRDITGSVTFETKRPIAVCEVERISDPVAMIPMPDRNEYRVLIDGKLFSTTYPTGTKRFSAKIIKPFNGGPIEIHLVKKYTKLAARISF